MLHYKPNSLTFVIRPRFETGTSRVKKPGAFQLAGYLTADSRIKLTNTVRQCGLESTGSKLGVVAGPCKPGCTKSGCQVAVLTKFYTLKVKVNFTLDQATKAQTGSRGIALLFNLGAG